VRGRRERSRAADTDADADSDDDADAAAAAKAEGSELSPVGETVRAVQRLCQIDARNGASKRSPAARRVWTTTDLYRRQLQSTY
jgi:hypothetical protein